MTEPLDFDAIVIGGGSAGFAGARLLANGGLRTAVLEGGSQVGGLCILRGCMPTKALLHASELMHAISAARGWGISTGKPRIDFPKVMARKDELIREFADYRREQLENSRFSFIRDSARFTDPNTVELSSGQKLRATNFLIATGSGMAPPPFPALQSIHYINSDDALALQELPQSMVILGGGAVACEFAQFFVRFGVKVTLIQRGKFLLKEFDSDAATVIEKVFQREGMQVYSDTELKDAWIKDGSKGIVFQQRAEEKTVEADEVFFGLGRQPNTESLRLDLIGLNCIRKRIVTNLSMETNLSHIYAAGDCTGPYEIVHIAIQQAEVAAQNILNPSKKRNFDYRLLTSVVFTDPQLATVGLTEKEAHAQNVPFLAASYPFSDHGKSMILGATDGFVKLLANPVTGEILGGCCAGPLGGELIHEIIAAMHRRMTVKELTAMPHYHPTLAEIWTYPAEELADQIQGG